MGGHKGFIIMDCSGNGSANRLLVEAQVEHAHQMPQLVLAFQLLIKQSCLNHGPVHTQHIFLGVIHDLGFTSVKFATAVWNGYLL